MTKARSLSQRVHPLAVCQVRAHLGRLDDDQATKDTNVEGLTILDFFAVGVKRYPSRGSYLEDGHDQPRKLILRKTMDVGREQSSNVILKTAEEDATNGVLECEFLLIFGLLYTETRRRVVGSIALRHFLLQTLLSWAG